MLAGIKFAFLGRSAKISNISTRKKIVALKVAVAYNLLLYNVPEFFK